MQLIGRYGGGEGDAPGADDTRENVSLLTDDGLAALAKYADGIGPALTHLVVVGANGTARPNDVVRRAHAAGLVVHPYTFRTDALPKFAPTAPALLELLFGPLAVDGLFADQPDVVAAFLKNPAR